MKKKFIKFLDELKPGPCLCLIRNRYTGEDRVVKGEVSPVPYKKNATKETKQKYGKNLVYVIYRNYEDIVGYYQ